MRHTFTLALSLSAFWLVNSGHYTIFMLFLGSLGIIFVLYIAHRMDVVDHESQPIHLTRKLPGYYAWLIKEIILSNIMVVKHIWLGNKSISPTLSTIKVTQKTDIGKVIYANSITLTPGTITINMEGDQFLVHALLRESIDDLQTGEMDRRVTQLESPC